MKKFFKGDIVKLKSNVIIGHSYGGMALTRNEFFAGELAVEWSNDGGLVKLSNCKYYTQNMLERTGQ